ncbi:hypothetical protein HaLaN_23262 [Haematococcus lacustris]|uniref:Uncharacterized protein n=1 Tax=Haematococcus lacustris TaxID=44745 RepID=A0A6A0A4B3_HAELA|nr:hypothetical protein HaLaN_23262 [Haematococcus lacustris]
MVHAVRRQDMTTGLAPMPLCPACRFCQLETMPGRLISDCQLHGVALCRLANCVDRDEALHRVGSGFGRLAASLARFGALVLSLAGVVAGMKVASSAHDIVQGKLSVSPRERDKASSATAGSAQAGVPV